jgi:predicted GH43/DUF377 family glycosyl hydrolase
MQSLIRTNIHLKADHRKVILKFLNFGNAVRYKPVIDAVQAMEEATAEAQLNHILAEFEHRHFDLKAAFLENFEKIGHYVPGVATSQVKRLLIGAYFTHEYSIQAAALFNPSIVPHADQTELPVGALRIILSLRATGEGHISSIAFLTGVLSENGELTLDPPSDKLTTGQCFPKENSENAYDLHFPDYAQLNGRVLFPQSTAESNGTEDARFVLFHDGEKQRYLATYTAYNGRAIFPQLIETTNFKDFKIRPLHGAAASDKGMAFFPEKINGKYAMIGRQGGRSLSIMFSDDLHQWDEYRPLQHPQRNWELLQMGNCGSPIRTPKGWLLLTHAVGAMRKYVLSLSLLDLNDPGKVIASLDQPLLSPNAEEREGYVPNVLYTCGMLLHNGRLVIPYAMSDSAISFATVELEEVLFEMMNDK